VLPRVPGHTRRRLLLVSARLAAATAAAIGWARPAWAKGAAADESPPLSADVRIYEATTAHNSYPDGCDGRLERLYIAEDLELMLEVTFNRELTATEQRQVRWAVSGGAARPAGGDFVDLSNPARVSTTVTSTGRAEAQEATVRVTYQGADLTPPLPLRVISNAEYDAALKTLTDFTRLGGDTHTEFPLTMDLLARFLGQPSFLAGMPSIGSFQLSICDPRLTHRAGADWGPDTVTDVPLVQYASDQPAATIVAEGVAVALLSAHAPEIRQYFAETPDATSLPVDYTSSGNLTLDFPLDALFALHGVQFDGSLSASVAAPSDDAAALTASNVQVNGTVADLYDFDVEATGAGAFSATQAAKVQIGSVKHDVGKVFVVGVDLDTMIEWLDFDRRPAQ
jgi:hypothetical protein